MFYLLKCTISLFCMFHKTELRSGSMMIMILFIMVPSYASSAVCTCPVCIPLPSVQQLFIHRHFPFPSRRPLSKSGCNISFPCLPCVIRHLISAQLITCIITLRASSILHIHYNPLNHTTARIFSSVSHFSHGFSQARCSSSHGL